MKREKQNKPISDELLDELLKQGRTAEDVNGLLQQITKAVLERALQGEITEHLGCLLYTSQGGVAALFPFDINVWYGAPAQAAAVDDWADDNYDHSGLGFIGGTCLQTHTEMHPIEAASMSTFGQAPAWGSRWKAFVRDNAARWVSAYLQTSTFPYEDTYLDLDREVKDPLGDPVCRITSPPKENESRAAEYGQKKMDEWFRAAGATEVLRGGVGPAAVSTHAYGGTRMGDDPEANVVDLSLIHI